MSKALSDWTESSLGAVCELYQPKTISRKLMVENGEYLVYGANGIIGRYSKYNHQDSEVLLSCRGNCGTVNVSAPYSWINGNAMVCKPRDGNLLKDYLKYFLESVNWAPVITGTAQPQITREPLAKVGIQIPPVSEQYQIIEILEDHLSRLDAALADVKRAKNFLVRLNRSTLENLIKPESDWAETTIGQISSTIRNGIFVSRPSSEPSGVPILRIGSVRAMHLELNDLRYTGLSEANAKIAGNLLDVGDLLFTRYNGNAEYVAACAEVPKLPTPITYPDKLIRVALVREFAHPSFVAMACSGGSTRAYLRSKVKTTAGQAGISGIELKSAKIFLPPLEEQIRRANEYQDFVAAQQSINSTIQTSINNSESLRRSLLQAAFTGQLTKKVTNV